MTNHDAIYALYPNVTYINGNNAFDANGNEIATDATAINNWLTSKNYIVERQKSYPSIANQLDMLWHMIDQGLPFDKTSVFYTTLATVKTNYPKPTGN